MCVCVCVCVYVCVHIVGISGDTDSGLLSQDAGPDHTRHVAEDTVSLCGVGGEVDVMNELRQRRPMSTKSTASPGVGLGVVHSAPEPAAAHVGMSELSSQLGCSLSWCHLIRCAPRTWCHLIRGAPRLGVIS